VGQIAWCNGRLYLTIKAGLDIGKTLAALMAPRGSSTGPRAGRRGASNDRRKGSQVAGQKADIQFLASLTPEATSKEFSKLASIIANAAGRGLTDTLQAACHTTARLSEEESGFFGISTAGCLDTIMTIVHADPRTAGGEVATTQEICFQRAVSWCETVDHLDFTKVGLLMDMVNRYADKDEDIAVSSLGAMERFAAHRLENCITMLHAGVIPLLHRILAAHRTPELCQDVFAVLYRICDVPGSELAEHIAQEKTLVLSIVETMGHAPLNMRLQVSGLRLLALFSRLHGNSELQEAIEEAGAQAALQRTLADLERAGFTHIAAWASVVGGMLRVPRPPTP